MSDVLRSPSAQVCQTSWFRCFDFKWANLKGGRRPRGLLVSLPALDLIICVVTSLSLGGCSWGPLRDASSLSPAVQADTVAYNDAVGDAADRILLANILRAKDFAPMNLSQLSSVSGALSLQGSLGLSVPFGPAWAMNSKTYAQNTGTPSITAGSTPTYTVTPLNTQGFTLTILQPLFANYVLSLLQEGFPPEVLLNLFIKEIDFPRAASNFSAYRYVNDPDDPTHFNAFQDLVKGLVDHHVLLKAMDVLEPAGPEFGLHVAPSIPQRVTTDYTDQNSQPAQGTNQAARSTQVTTYQLAPDNADSAGFGLVTSSSDAQYHVGNTPRDRGQLFRVYPAQIEMCVDDGIVMKYPAVPPMVSPYWGAGQSGEENGRNVAGVAPTIQDLFAAFRFASPAPEVLSLWDSVAGIDQPSVNPIQMAQNVSVPVEHTYSAPFLSSGSGAASPAPAAGGSGGGSHGGGGSSAASGSTPSQATVPVLQAPRISALVRGDCQQDQIILHGFSDEKLIGASKTFVHIYWRSPSEIFEYLGAILRYNHSPNGLFAVQTRGDTTIASSPSGQSENKDPSIFFDLEENGPGALSITYNGRVFAVRDVDPKNPKGDYTRPILSVASTLINLASQPSAIQTSTPLRLLPIP